MGWPRLRGRRRTPSPPAKITAFNVDTFLSKGVSAIIASRGGIYTLGWDGGPGGDEAKRHLTKQGDEFYNLINYHTAGQEHVLLEAQDTIRLTQVKKTRAGCKKRHCIRALFCYNGKEETGVSHKSTIKFREMGQNGGGFLG